MKKLTVLVLVVASLLEVQVRDCRAAAAAPTEIVFPPPPDKPRVRFVRSIKTRRDVAGGKAGVLTKVVEFLSGGSIDKPIVQRPYAIWIEGDQAYLSDTDNQRAVRVSLVDGKEQTFGEGGDGDLQTPIGVAADQTGNLYVSDTGDHSVKSFAPDGKLRWKVDVLAPGNKLSKPSGLATTPAGELIVMDAGNHRVVYLSSEGKYLREGLRNMKDPFALPNPANVWVEADGGLVISDPLMSRVHCFAGDGKYRSGFGEAGDSAGYLARPKGVATDSNGNIHVVDAVFNRVQVFDREGQLLVYYGKPGSGPGELALPAGIFIDRNDRIYVVDSKNKRLQLFEYIKYPKDEIKPAAEKTETPQAR